MHFHNLLAVYWPGAKIAWDNHALACNCARHSPIKKNSLTENERFISLGEYSDSLEEVTTVKRVARAFRYFIISIIIIIIIIITLCNTEKYKNQAGMNFTPPPLSQQDATRRIDWTQWLNGNLLLLLLLINGVASLTGEFACGVVVIWLGRSVVGRLLQQHSTGQCQPTSGLRRTDNAK